MTEITAENTDSQDFTARRAARLGDGWIGSGGTGSEGAAKLIARLHELRREYGRENEPFEVTVSARSMKGIGDLERYRDAGVTRLVLVPPMPERGSVGIDGVREFVGTCASEYFPKL